MNRDKNKEVTMINDLTVELIQDHWLDSSHAHTQYNFKLAYLTKMLIVQSFVHHYCFKNTAQEPVKHHNIFSPCVSADTACVLFSETYALCKSSSLLKISKNSIHFNVLTYQLFLHIWNFKHCPVHLLFVKKDLTYSMEQSPSGEANRFSASQEIPQILWYPKIHYRIHKCPPPVPIISNVGTIFCT